MTTDTIKQRIEAHAKAAQAAQERGDRDRYVEECKAMLRAQYELWQATRREAPCPA